MYQLASDNPKDRRHHERHHLLQVSHAPCASSIIHLVCCKSQHVVPASAKRVGTSHYHWPISQAQRWHPLSADAMHNSLAPKSTPEQRYTQGKMQMPRHCLPCSLFSPWPCRHGPVVARLRPCDIRTLYLPYVWGNCSVKWKTVLRKVTNKVMHHRHFRACRTDHPTGLSCGSLLQPSPRALYEIREAAQQNSGCSLVTQHIIGSSSSTCLCLYHSCVCMWVN